jgi:hypothetical protein
MIKASKIFVVSILIGVFGVFSVGLPIVKYLCPMMNDANPVCCMSGHSRSDASSVTYQNPGCCASLIVAERSTVPYYSIEKSASTDLTVLQFATLQEYRVRDLFSSAIVIHGISPPPHLGSDQLYLLNSSFLI